MDRKLNFLLYDPPYSLRDTSMFDLFDLSNGKIQKEFALMPTENLIKNLIEVFCEFYVSKEELGKLIGVFEQLSPTVSVSNLTYNSNVKQVWIETVDPSANYTPIKTFFLNTTHGVLLEKIILESFEFVHVDNPYLKSHHELKQSFLGKNGYVDFYIPLEKTSEGYVFNQMLASFSEYLWNRYTPPNQEENENL
jgi:hypothetical protein